MNSIAKYYILKGICPYRRWKTATPRIRTGRIRMIGTEWKFDDCKVVEQEADGNVVFDVHFPSGKVQRMYPDGIEDVEGCYAAFAMGMSPVGQEDGHGNIVCEVE